MKPFPTQACSPALLARLRQISGPTGTASFHDFTALALYDADCGYYTRRNLPRVGRQPDADFYTSSSLQGGIFGRLTRAAAAQLLRPALPAEFTLLEIAAEPGAGIFTSEAGSFAKTQALCLGQELIPDAKSAIFANEWLDAQPFHRLVFRRGQWRELGVRTDAEMLEEVELLEPTAAVQKLWPELPQAMSEDYHLDISLAAEAALAALASRAWSGCLMLADYGHDWTTLLNERPAGTARAYSKHEITGDLLANPGEQDLTCHVCWDRLEKILKQHGFTDLHVERQEACFVRLAGAEIERILQASAGTFSKDRQTLLELLHPAHLGQKFQILSARRGVSP